MKELLGNGFLILIVTNIFKKLSDYFDLFINPNFKVKIMNFQCSIVIKDILDTCFIKKKYDKKCQQLIHYGEEYYYFDKMGIIFVK